MQAKHGGLFGSEDRSDDKGAGVLIHSGYPFIRELS